MFGSRVLIICFLALGTAGGQQSASTLIYPTAGITNVPSFAAFSWTAVSGATGYYLYVGTTEGAKDVINTGSIQATSYTPSVPLPPGQTLWARIYTQLNGHWIYQNDVSFTISAAAALINPVNNQQNVPSFATFSWTAVSGATGYYLYVGTTEGAKDVINTGSIQATSYTPSVPLPPGQTLWARIYTQLNGHWIYQNDVSFTVSSAAALISPTDNQQNVLSNATFSWNAVSGATGYYLYVGTTEGAKDVINTGSIQATSYTPSVPLPPGQTLWARIYTQLNGHWIYQNDVSFTVSSAAALISPTDNQQNVFSNATFSWNAVSGATGYYLYVGTTEGAKDVINTGSIQATSYTPSVPLPPGQTLWARIYTQLNGHWIYQNDVSFTISAAAALINPVNNQQNVPYNTTFTWTSAPGATGYYLYVGTFEGAKDVINTGEISQTSYASSFLQPGAALWARIYSYISGNWVYQNDVQFTVSDASALVYPSYGQQNVDTSVAFSWSQQTNAQAYQLYVGTSPGGSDLANSGVIQSTSFSVPVLPVGQTLYARIWSEVNGVWSYSADVPFTAAPRFVNPAVRALDIDPTMSFTWSPQAGGSCCYHLSVGTSPGGSDLYDNATLASPSANVPLGDLPEGSTLYARVSFTPGDGETRVADTVFSVAGTPVNPAQMIYPTDGATNVDASQPFQWASNALAQAYRLQISNNAGIIVDSGPITVSRYFAESLPLGSYTAQLGSEFGDQWYWTNLSFTVTQDGGNMANELASALWATDYVRQMADLSNWAFPWTSLMTELRTEMRIQAYCSNYANTLVQVLGQMNIASRFPEDLQPQVFNIAFLWNGFDTHTLVQYWNSDQESWMILDPTFDMTMTRASDGLYASMQDMQAATLSQQWSAINYQFLGSWGSEIANDYYLDYPLLYVNIPPVLQIGQGNDVSQFLVQQNAIPSSGVFFLQCSGSVNLLVNGVSTPVPCNNVDSLTNSQTAGALSPGSTATIFTPVRNVFVP